MYRNRKRLKSKQRKTEKTAPTRTSHVLASVLEAEPSRIKSAPSEMMKTIIEFQHLIISAWKIEEVKMIHRFFLLKLVIGLRTSNINYYQNRIER
ncbi:CLUMA_CG001457, isoform A [Clunio marinus]|uniref:CLUMA_CG001457, isoform A n=1 Tax=Clunio marinus TaxID=568069 RepID=A0A1J1HHZ7_9DIPT|nr:CLUMA_CG001457, isoform A [Clunio marinus]